MVPDLTNNWRPKVIKRTAGLANKTRNDLFVRRYNLQKSQKSLKDGHTPTS